MQDREDGKEDVVKSLIASTSVTREQKGKNASLYYSCVFSSSFHRTFLFFIAINSVAS